MGRFAVTVSGRDGAVVALTTVPLDEVVVFGSDGGGGVVEEGSSMRYCVCGVLVTGVPPVVPGMPCG